MKKALLAVFGSIIILIFLLISFTLFGRNIRQTEVDNALAAAMQSAMEQLLLEEGKPATEEEWKAMFVEAVCVQIESSSELAVHILDADMEKGLLCAEAVLTFRHPIGTTGSVTTGARTIILEEYIAE